MLKSCYGYSSNPLSLSHGGVGPHLVGFIVHGVLVSCLLLVLDSSTLHKLWLKLTCTGQDADGYLNAGCDMLSSSMRHVNSSEVVRVPFILDTGPLCHYEDCLITLPT